MKSKNNVLVITPYSDYGNLICNSLRNIVTGSMKSVSTIHSINKYINLLGETNYLLDLVILDLELGFEKLSECVSIVRDNNPSVEIILVSKNDPPEEAEDLRPWTLLRKPFVEKDLLEIIRTVFSHQRVNVIDGKFIDNENLQLPMWARNKERLIITMNNSLEGLDAQGAILLSADEIIASTGILRDEKEKESCSKILYKYMDFSGNGEIIKQVKISEQDYLMHALILTVGIIIALLFDPETSYKLIRGQTRKVAGRITQPALPDDDSISEKNSFYKEKISSSNIPYSTESVQVKKFPKTRNLEQSNNLYNRDESVEVGKRLTYLRGEELHYGNQKKYSENPYITKKMNYEYKRPSIISVGLSQLPFTCLLIPRLNPKSISNDLVDFLEEKTPMIFLSYGWRLNDILINKNMMQWIAAIPPIIAPAFQIKTIRKETSKLIFENFPKMSMDGLMKDFWVPGYLVAIGSERISENEKNEMIENNQQRYFLDGPNNITGCAQNVLYNNL